MSTGISGPSTLMATDETVYMVRQPTEVPQGVTYVDGKPVRDAAQMLIFPCVCNVQPIGGKELALLDSGDETTDQLYVWTQNDADMLMIGDLMTRENRRYQCQATDAWGNYTRARFALDQTLAGFDPAQDVSFLP